MNYPLLELVWTPTGRPCVVHGHTWAVGDVEPLGPGLSFGIEGDVRLPYPADAKEICRIEPYAGRLRLWQHAKKYCVVNGRFMKDREAGLQHRDLIAMPRGPLFRVLETELVTAHSPGLEAALRATPHDKELLHVWSDYLLDQGDPFGERLSRWRAGKAPDDDTTWLDVFAPHYDAGALTIEWNGGIAARAVLRESLSAFNSLDAALNHFFSLRVMQFVEDLVVDISSDKLSVPGALHALKKVKLPPTLKRLSLGDVPDTERTAAAPLIEAFGRPLELGYYSEAQLQILHCSAEMNHRAGENLGVGDHLELGRTAFSAHVSHNVLIGGSYIVARDGPRFVLARLLTQAMPAKVNGRPVDHFPLREGNLIELGTNLAARFKLIR